MNRDADIEKSLVDTLGKGEGGTNGESSTETYTLPYVKQIPNGKLLYSTELNTVLCDNLVGGMGWGVEERFKRQGTCVYLWLICVVWKKTTHIVKQLSSY